MKLLFTRRATGDIEAIAAYVRRENPAAAQRVRATILASLNVLVEFPRLGRLQANTTVRKYVTPKYPYLVYYEIDEQRDALVALTVRHPAREREYENG